MLLDGKKLLITGVLTDDSIAFSVAKVAQEAGAEILLTGVGRGLRLTERVARRLPTTPDVLELDINNPEHVEAVSAEVMKRWGKVDGVVHAIGFMPDDALGGNFLNTPWESVAFGFQTSAFSLKALAVGMLEPMKAAGGGIGRHPHLRRPLRVADLRLDGRRQGRPRGDDPLPGARPGRVRDPGQRRLGRPDPHHGRQEHPRLRRDLRHLAKRAPLGWNMTDATAVGQMCCFLLSDWSTMTSGELIHVDGGYHAMGTDIRR